MTEQANGGVRLVVVSETFLWGQQVRVKRSARNPQLQGAVGTLHAPPFDSQLVAVLQIGSDIPWRIDRGQEWEFERVTDVKQDERSFDGLRLRQLIGQTVRVVRRPPGFSDWLDGIVQVSEPSAPGAFVGIAPIGGPSIQIYPRDAEHWGFTSPGAKYDDLVAGLNKSLTAASSPATGATDDVNHPRHYNAHPSGHECIDLMEHLGTNVNSAFKYLWRADEKHETPLTDLKKALWYLERELGGMKLTREAAQEAITRAAAHQNYHTGSAMVAIYDYDSTGSVEDLKSAAEHVRGEIERLEKR